MPKNVLIVGGSSGLGLELAKIYSVKSERVFITGRKNQKFSPIKFLKFPITPDTEDLIKQIDKLVFKIKKIDLLIYAAGFYQEGHIDDLDDKQILEMVNVGLTTAALLVRRLKKNSAKPLEIIFITSSSQFIPRELEPMYTAVKSGLGMLGNSLSLDPKISKVLVAAPCGMKTPFWDKNWDTLEYLEPKWVAEQIIKLFKGRFKYKFAKILRSPGRIEMVEIRRD